MPMFRRFDRDFFKVWSSEMAYVLGFIFADGTVFKNKRGAFFLEITSTDVEIIKKIRKIMNSDHKIGIREPKKAGWKRSYRLQIGSKEMVNDLMRFGVIQNKSLVVSFPKVPDKFLRHFIRGYFDGDGGVYIKKYNRKDRPSSSWVFSTRFTSGSRKFLEGLWNSLRGTLSGGFIYKKNRCFDLAFSTNDSLALFKFMYNSQSSLFLRRKYRTFQKAFEILKMQT